MLRNSKPYTIDWRFLPDGLLARKDTLRHYVNRLGGDGEQASTIGKAWFGSVRAGVVRAIASAGVIFVHVPRTGGSAVSRALYGRNLPHLSIAYYRSLGSRRLAGLPSFAIVRDPLDRLASAHRFLRAGGTPLMASSRYDPRGLSRSPSFDAFVETIAFDPDARYRYDPLRPQAEFVADAAGRLLVDRLFTFDELRACAPALLPWIGGAAVARINETAAAPIRCSASTRRLVEALYARDHALYERTRAGSTAADDLARVVVEGALTEVSPRLRGCNRPLKT